MGLLAVFDTFLIYKIAQKQCHSRVAFFASLLFAVMPMTWITRRILLDSILLPFVLLSILFVICSKDSTKKNWLVLLSGVFLGLAILTKIPAFTMIPLVAYLTYSHHKDKRLLVLLLIPVVLIPMIWPAYSITHDQFEYWKKDVLWQSQRQNAGIQNTALSFGAIDPVMFGLGIAGLVYSAMRKNVTVLLWILPFVVFLSLIGYTQYFHWMMILPGFCIAAAILISDLGKQHSLEAIRRYAPVLTMISITSFGLASTILLLNLNVSENQFESAVYAANYALEHNIVVFAGPHTSWIYNDVLESSLYKDYSMLLFDKIPENYILLADPHFHLDSYRGKILEYIYDYTTPIASFDSTKSKYDVYQYPYSSLGYNYDAGLIEIRISPDLTN
jgi:4-amino-4-deoxy-L-arabinose transferase-like glycosyltransferase